jgi:hypothetical protein
VAAKKIFKNKSPCDQSAGSGTQGSSHLAWNPEASVVVLAVMMEIVNAVLCPGLLLREQSPGVSRNRPFLTIHADDKKFTFRSNKRSEMPVQKFSQ